MRETKDEIRDPKLKMGDENPNRNLEERTFQFALAVRHCLAAGCWSRTQSSDVDQLLRSSGSVAANYVEANNAVSRPDFAHRIGVAKKEANESMIWIRLLGETSAEPSQDDLRKLYREADEVTRILGAIRRKTLES